MARNRIPLNDIVNDFLLLHKDDDYANNLEEFQARAYAKRGLRQLTFDVSGVVKSILLPLDTATMSCELPDDYVNFVRIGTIGTDGLFYVFGENKNVTAMLRYDYDINGDEIGRASCRERV